MLMPLLNQVQRSKANQAPLLDYLSDPLQRFKRYPLLLNRLHEQGKFERIREAETLSTTYRQCGDTIQYDINERDDVE